MQDAPLEVRQVRAGIQAQGVDQRGRRPALSRQRLGLAAAAVQGRHQLDLEALAQGVGGGQGAQGRHDLRVAPEGELGLEQPLLGDEAQLVESHRLPPGPAEVGELLVGAAAPVRQRRQQRPLDTGGRAGGRLQRPLEPGRVDRVLADGQEVPAGPGRHHRAARRQQVPELGHVGAQSGDRAAVGLVLP